MVALGATNAVIFVEWIRADNQLYKAKFEDLSKDNTCPNKHYPFVFDVSTHQLQANSSQQRSSAGN